jgi:hypothetical protein
MNRTIKFRGKDLLDRWRYGDLVQEKWKSLLDTNEKAYMIKKDKRAELEKKDKIIDLMAEVLVKVPESEDNLIIAQVINSNLEEKKQKVKQYFEKEVNNPKQ